MSVLFGKPRTIHLVSPQPWNSIPVSKHNYARELAMQGHRVVFIEPPVRDGSITGIRLFASDLRGLDVLRYAMPFPYALKFHARTLFARLMSALVARIVSAAGSTPDLVWDFDNGFTTTDLRAFRAKLAVFHPVDDFEPRRNADKHADLVLSVAQRYLDRISPQRVPAHLIPHGLARTYEALARAVVANPHAPARNRAICVGMVGNLDRADIDWRVIARMVGENPCVTFLFTGPVTPETIRQSPERAAFAAVFGAPNAVFEGRKTPDQIIARTSDVDLWLLAYDPAVGTNAATNSHKLLEYLATGSPVVANRVDAYAGNDHLLMPADASNAHLPALLSGALANIQSLNAPARRSARAAFALKHTYRVHLERISGYFDEVVSARHPASRAHG